MMNSVMKLRHYESKFYESYRCLTRHNGVKSLDMTGRSSPGSTSLRGSHAPRVLTKQSPDYEVHLQESEFERDWLSSCIGLC